MNALVLVVAGIFVLAGITLIVLSIFLFRKRPGDVDREAPLVDEPLPAEPERVFIDEPLQTEFSPRLGPASAFSDSPDPTDTSDLDDREDVTAETAAPPITAKVEETAPPARTAHPDHSLLSYNFRVRVAADHVQRGHLREAIAEFQKALTLTDDGELRSHLLAEVGNAYRELGEPGPAARAYASAAEQTASDGLRAHLERSADEMRQAIAGSSADPAPTETPKHS
jgi:hypothetical protein